MVFNSMETISGPLGILEKIAVGVLGVPQLVPRPLSQDPLLTAKGPLRKDHLRTTFRTWKALPVILGAQRTLLAAQDP